MEIRAKRSLGQNFLKDQKIIESIVDVGEITNNKVVLEIGPGTGALTEAIVKKKPKEFTKRKITRTTKCGVF